MTMSCHDMVMGHGHGRSWMVMDMVRLTDSQTQCVRKAATKIDARLTQHVHGRDADTVSIRSNTYSQRKCKNNDRGRRRLGDSMQDKY